MDKGKGAEGLNWQLQKKSGAQKPQEKRRLMGMGSVGIGEERRCGTGYPGGSSGSGEQGHLCFAAGMFEGRAAAWWFYYKEWKNGCLQEKCYFPVHILYDEV